jgi:hypothetical protein
VLTLWRQQAELSEISSDFNDGNKEAFCRTLWLFLSANSSGTSWNLLVQFIRHPSVRPIALKIVFGNTDYQSDMLDQVPFINHESDVPKVAGGYHIEMIPSVSRTESAVPEMEHVETGEVTRLSYSGSAMGEDGLYARIKGHRKILGLDPATVAQKRMVRRSKPTPFLWVHEECLRLRAKARIRLTYQLPLHRCNSSKVRLQLLCIGYLMETLDCVLFGSVSTKIQPSPFLARHVAACRLFRHSRPASMAQSPFRGMNLSPPFCQINQALATPADDEAIGAAFQEYLVRRNLPNLSVENLLELQRIL